jgi:outer membrane protein TolC
MVVQCAKPVLGESQVVSDNKTTPCKKEFTLAEFRAVAFENSPLLAEIDSEYAGQLAQAFQAEVLGNPQLQLEQVYTSMKIGGADDPQSVVSVSQPVRLSDFGSRSRVASLLRKVGDSHKRVKLLEFSQRIALQFYTLYAFQRSESILNDSERRAGRKMSLIHEGVKKGLLSEGEHKVFEGEQYRLRAQIKGLQSSMHALSADIAQSLGFVCEIQARAESSFPPIPKQAALIQKAQESGLSESARAELIAALTSEQARLAELDAFPEISPRLVYQHTNDGGDFFGVGIAVPLPIFNRNQAERIRADAASEARQRQKEFLSTGGIEARIQRMYMAAETAAQQEHIFSTKVVPAFEEALRAQEKLYGQGKGNVLEVWQALRALSDSRREALTIWLSAVTTRMQLSLLVGEEI